MLDAVREMLKIKIPIWVLKRKAGWGGGTKTKTKLTPVLVGEQWRLLLLWKSSRETKTMKKTTHFQ